LCTEAGLYQKDPWTTNCCWEGDESDACKTEKTDNVCSPSIANGGGGIPYAYCPLINKTRCGEVDHIAAYN